MKTEENIIRNNVKAIRIHVSHVYIISAFSIIQFQLSTPQYSHIFISSFFEQVKIVQRVCVCVLSQISLYIQNANDGTNKVVDCFVLFCSRSLSLSHLFFSLSTLITNNSLFHLLIMNFPQNVYYIHMYVHKVLVTILMSVSYLFHLSMTYYKQILLLFPLCSCYNSSFADALERIYSIRIFGLKIKISTQNFLYFVI